MAGSSGDVVGVSGQGFQHEILYKNDKYELIKVQSVLFRFKHDLEKKSEIISLQVWDFFIINLSFN